MIRITNNHHNEFLKTLPEVEREKNYDELRCWNSKFKVHECPTLLEGKLPERPHRENLSTIKDFLMLSDNKQNRVTKIMEEIVKENELKAQVPTSGPIQQQKNVSGLSEKLLAKVRAKEQAMAKETAERQKKHSSEKYTILQEELKKVAERLKIYFTMRSVSSMFLVNVAEHLVKNNADLKLGSSKILFIKHSIKLFLDEALKYVEELCNICPEWLSITEFSNNKLLKMDKTLSIQVVYGKIERGITM